MSMRKRAHTCIDVAISPYSVVGSQLKSAANDMMFASKNASEYYDPCQDFADRSLKCMKRNGFDREMCHDYFQ